ncbi:uncharacterized protein LOC123513143 [Portunus trituberculatus]|uniref:uncharacterized protein LOC123513143 n=1 Tax=Portunus trituberculatus TaxID=210409 RepID=UPI001E1CDCB4|nr:uncharacterized protein LOC123513143 [Portunus trituberculatus]
MELSFPNKVLDLMEVLPNMDVSDMFESDDYNHTSRFHMATGWCNNLNFPSFGKVQFTRAMFPQVLGFFVSLSKENVSLLAGSPFTRFENLLLRAAVHLAAGIELTIVYQHMAMVSHTEHFRNQGMRGLTQQQCGYLLLAIYLLRERDEPPRVWTRPWLSRRLQESVYFRLVRELSLEDPDLLREWIRLDRTQYQHVLRLVTSLIEKQGTNMRQPVSAGERLMLTLKDTL